MAWDIWQQRQITDLYQRIIESNDNKISPEQAIMMQLARTGLYG